MGVDPSLLTRKDFLAAVAAWSLCPSIPAQETQSDPTSADMEAYERLVGLEFTPQQRELAGRSVAQTRRAIRQLRDRDLANSIEPPLVFTPRPGGDSKKSRDLAASPLRSTRDAPPDRLLDLPVRQLASLLRSKKVSSTELTRLALTRLRTVGAQLNCVVTLTEELALAEAASADQELASGKARGLLHGIPYGVKDLFAVKGYRTTWGAEAFKDQVVDLDATVVERLRSAGAVLCAKLSCGALAYDDVWFGGQTKNPWNLSQGSSGSSAGSASAMAAGLVGFTIGTETLGSIVSPSVRCRTTGLRPSYGRVSRHGGMVLSWTMDKVGPICRSAEDCGIVFAAIHGRDPLDPTSVDRPFDWRPGASLKGLKVGVLAEDMDQDWRPKLERLVGSVSPVKLTPPPMEYLAVLTVEAASAFEPLIRDSRIDQIGKLWPPEFLAARYYPAVEYLRAQQARAQMMSVYARETAEFDVLVAEGSGSNQLITTNGTGHPQVVIPWGTDSRGGPRSVSFFGRMDGEAALLTVAQSLQETAEFHRQMPQVAHSS